VFFIFFPFFLSPAAGALCAPYGRAAEKHIEAKTVKGQPSDLLCGHSPHGAALPVWRQESPGASILLHVGPRDNGRWWGRPCIINIMNIRQTMYKLQTALNLSGRRIKINQFQSWSELQKRMVTKYVITENGATIIESYHAAEAVQTLAELLQGGD
jgi:hypothetical protein